MDHDGIVQSRPPKLQANFEFNVEAYSRMAALDISTYIERQIAGARRIDTDTLKKEPRLIQLRNRMVALLSPFL